MENIQLDILSLGIGLLIGFVISLLIKFKSLKSLGLKLDKIGLDLGVEGFETFRGEGGHAITITKSELAGDVAVGNIDKSVRETKFFRNIRKIVSGPPHRLVYVGVGNGRYDITFDIPFNNDSKLNTSRMNSAESVKACYDQFFKNKKAMVKFNNKLQKIEQDGWRVGFIDSHIHEDRICFRTKLVKQISV